jgi:hypothetical protein
MSKEGSSFGKSLSKFIIVISAVGLGLRLWSKGMIGAEKLAIFLVLVFIAALLIPLHHKLEKWATAKLIEKNRQIRLAAAKKTIQQLDTNPDNS